MTPTPPTKLTYPPYRVPQIGNSTPIKGAAPAKNGIPSNMAENQKYTKAIPPHGPTLHQAGAAQGYNCQYVSNTH